MSVRKFHIKTVTVTVDTTRLERARTEIRRKAHAILDKASFDIETAAKSLAPVDTGALKSSIYVSGTSGNRSNYSARQSEAKGRGAGRGKRIEFNDEIRPDGEYQRVIAPSVHYGVFPELQGQPYLAPAVEQHRRPFLEAWEKLFEDVR